MRVFLVLVLLAPAVAAAPASLQAGVIHKWVDEKGVTHYADDPPANENARVTRVEVDAAPARATAAQDDYYSIINQWQRMHRERLQRDRIALEKARIDAARISNRSTRRRAEEKAEHDYSRGYIGHYYPVYPHRYKRARHGYKRGRFAPGLHPGRNRLRGGYNP